MSRKAYPTDLTEAQWRIVEPLVPPVKPGGRPALHPRRELVNAMLYVLRSAGAWRLLPHEFPPWQTVYHYFRLWRDDGTWVRINAVLREGPGAGRPAARSQCGHPGQPVGQDHRKRGPRGYDGGKKVKGRKRHLLVDTGGLLLRAVVHPANVADREGGKLVLGWATTCHA